MPGPLSNSTVSWPSREETLKTEADSCQWNDRLGMCFLGFKIFESDKERSFSIKLQRIMVSGVWSLWRDYKFWGKSLQEIFIKRFHFILITFHKSSRSNSFIFEYSRWCWDDQTLWGGISKINLPPPELQQFYSSEPQHLGSSSALSWYHRTQHHLDYDITLSTVFCPVCGG